MYSKILVPLDGGELSERAIQQAEVIATKPRRRKLSFSRWFKIRSVRTPIAAGQTEVTKATTVRDGQG